jgi:Fur family ferric uptake transcriptional regulator
VAAVHTDLLTRLRDRSWRLSPQRRVVAEVLAGEHVHLSAEQVHARARQLLPEISRATVYNTLNELVALGEVIEIAPTGGPRRYDPNAHAAHDHLVCEVCHAIRDVPRRGSPRPAVADEDLGGYRVTDVDVVFRGVCPDCAARP